MKSTTANNLKRKSPSLPAQTSSILGQLHTSAASSRTSDYYYLDTDLLPTEERHKTDGHKGATNWILISKELNRGYLDCQWKSESLCLATLKKGPFTSEEDAIIVKRVEEWGDRGKGLWKVLESEMRRPARTLN